LHGRKKFFSLESKSARSVDAVREILISAIAITRQSGISDVQSELQHALHLFSPTSAKDAIVAALSVLDKFGGYEKPQVDKSEDEDTENEDLFETAVTKDNKLQEMHASLLCGEAMILEGCLSCDINANRDDWKDAILETRTVSRLAALVQVLIKKSISMLTKMDKDRKTLLDAIKSWDNKRSLRKEQKREKYGSSTEIWADTVVTDRFVLAKVEGYPWWPSRICSAKDNSITSALSTRNRVLISFVGDHNIRVVKSPSEICELNEKKKCINLSFVTEEKLKKLKKSLKMTERILDGRGDSVPLDWYNEKIKAVLQD